MPLSTPSVSATPDALRGRLLPTYMNALARLHLPEQSILQRTAWVRAFIKFHYDAHPSTLQEKHVRLFILHLRHHKKLSLMQCQARTSAILFLYRHVLGQPDFWIWDPAHPALAFTRHELML